MFQGDGLVFVGFLVAKCGLIVLILVNVVLEGGNSFTNNYVVSTNLAARADQSICIQLVISTMLQPGGFRWLRLAELFTVLLRALVGPEKGRPKESSIDCGLV